MRVLGMISGTSHDGIDTAIVDFTLSGEVLEARIEHAASTPYDDALRQRLVRALPPAPVGFDVACELDTRLGRAFATAAAAALEDHARQPGVGPVGAVCSHGQTVFHWVEDGRAEGTLQLGQPAWIAAATALPVVADLRAADIAAGGQGAPLVPVLDRLLLAPFIRDGARAGALNLGGIANVTACAGDADPVAWDIGPANALIDAVVTASSTTPDTFDRDGVLAGSGAVVPELLEVLLAEPYYALPAPKSSGKELFHLGYVEDAVRRAGCEPSLGDLVATLTELTAVTVADAVTAAALDVLVASGGGVRNPVLMNRLGVLLPGVRLSTTDELGVPSDQKEAVAFALVGWATLNGLPGNVPSCTGAGGERVLGSLTPAPERGLPELGSMAAWPTSLRFAHADPGVSA
jgi:anhydro-N-acetylmuramic acid kinase